MFSSSGTVSHNACPHTLLILGETEWSLNGRHTGVTDIDLTENGRTQLAKMAKTSIGEDSKYSMNRKVSRFDILELICPSTISLVLVSPLKRAQDTLKLLNLPNLAEPSKTLPDSDTGKVPVLITSDVIEWNYGDYEGVTSHDIHKTNPSWAIFNDGAPNGESPDDIAKRVDGVIAKVRQVHKTYKEGHKGVGMGDVLIVAHGHILRSFVTRWINLPVKYGQSFLLDAGAVSALSYEHHSLNEPAIALWNGKSEFP